jgi:calcium/calmodulin-dependent protein kinase I
MYPRFVIKDNIRVRLLILKQYRARFVQCLGWFDDRDHIYISMEYIKHGDLQSFINQGPCTESEAVLIISQVALALNFMHQNQFVHRDLKPLVGLLK